jgi:hypothetical protein
MILGSPVLQRRGASSYANTSLSSAITILASGSNPNGVIIRTLVINAAASRFAALSAGPNVVCQMVNQTFVYMGVGLLVPAGVDLNVNGNSDGGGNCQIHITWDVL